GEIADGERLRATACQDPREHAVLIGGCVAGLYRPFALASHVGTRRRAALASSTRPTGVVRGAARASAASPPAIASRASPRAPRGWGPSVSVGPVLRASPTITGKETVRAS